MHSSPTHTAVAARFIFPALLGWLLGSAVQLQQAALWARWIDLTLVLLALLVLVLAAVRSLALPVRLTLTLLAFSVFAFAATGLRASAFSSETLDSSLEGRDITLTGMVAAMPHYNEAGMRFRLEVESAQLDGKPVHLPTQIYLGWYSGYYLAEGGAATAGQLQRQPAAISAGERWQMTVRLKAPHGASNPHGFDYELWLWEQGLQATGYVRAGPRDTAPQRLARTSWHPVERWRQQVRDRIFERVGERSYAGLIAALVVGDQNAIERADWDVFRATGVAHLMSISGLHITMFAWLAALSLAWLWRRSATLCLWLPASSAALIGGVLLAFAYAFFSGWGVPSQRTVLMLFCVALLRLSGKRWPWPQVLLLACAVVVAADPWAMLQPGFWLSFVAVGVLFATDPGAGPPQGETAPSGGSAARVAASVGAIFHEQWVITLALTPLTLLLFGQVSVVGLAANALAIPWVTLLVTPLAMLGVLVQPLWDLAALAISALSWYLQTLAALPFATLTVAQAPLWAGAVGVLGGLLLAMQLPWSLRLMGLPLMLPVLLWQVPAPQPGQFELLAADIGQGNAVLVRTASHALLYDAGPRFSRESDAGNRVLVPLLRSLQLRLDLLVLSHRDIDHTGGAPAVLKMQPQAELLSSIEDDHELQALRQTRRCSAGQRWQWDGVDFEVLSPLAQDYELDLKSNAMSCVLRISNGLQTALLAGDIEQAQEQRLVEGAQQIRANLLLVPHHGSRFSSSAAFLDAVQPKFALVQAGYRNRFGHPAQSVLVHYEERGIRVIDSPHCGAASWKSVQAQSINCQRSQAPRYWQHRVP
ncbi:MAG: DNA internalization-related competence protein ComEC/Rec2 [Rhodoferax sp.]|nr:DNA internalization-related competence protein ComEC/Rec2 [Rhodoferax sp.]